MRTPKKLVSRLLRKHRVRARVTGTSARPRLTVFISNMHVSAQIIDDSKGQTLASASTVGNKAAKGSLSEKAALVGTELGKNAKKASVSKVVLDRNGRQYAGRLQAFADAARKEGLEF
ncbi:MAG TPA: 50S ribosomal protein L18 [Candidatus Saccharimonadales bacterium]